MVNTNKIYKILKSIIMIIFIMYAVRSCSYAADYWDGSFDKYMTFLENTKTLTNTGNAGWNEFIIREQNQLKNQITSKLGIGVNNCKGFLMSTNETSNYAQLFIITVNNGYEINNNSQLVGGSNVKGVQVRMWKDSNNLIRIDSTSTNNMGTGSYTGVLNSAPTNDNYYNAVINVGLGPIYDITFLTSNIIDNYKGQSYVYSYYYTYNNNNWLLGEVIGAEEADEVEIRLNHYDSNRRIATWYKSNLVNNKFSVNGSLVYRNDLYFVDYDFWKNGEIVITGRSWLTFMPPGTVINNGEIVSVGSGDNYSVQNSTNDILDSSNVDNEFNSFLSGDLSATLGYNDYNNPYQDIIFGLAYNICDVLLASGDVYFDYSMHGETPTRIYASQFTTPETPLKSFIRLSMVFGVLFVIYSQFKEIIEAISTARAPNVLHDIDADVYFYKM